MKLTISRPAILSLIFTSTFGLAGTVQATLTTFGDSASWSSAVGTQTSTTITDPAPSQYLYFGSGSASVTYGGVTFSTSSSISDGAFYNVGSLFSGNAAVLSSQQNSFGDENILITLSSSVTAFSLNFGTFGGSDVTFLLGNGDTFTTGSTADGYAASSFVGITDSAFSTILITSPDSVLNINNLVTANFTPSAVPEPSTIIAGALLLLPVGSSAARGLRKKLQTT